MNRMGSTSRALVFIGFLVLLGASEGAKILAFLPFPARSHQAVFSPILKELANRGHQVTAYLPFPMKDPPNNYKEVILSCSFYGQMQAGLDGKEMNKMTALQMTFMLYGMGESLQKSILALDEVQKLIHSKEEFDAVILESFFVQEPFAAFRHKFKAVGIELMPTGSSAWTDALTGNPHNPAYVVDMKEPFGDRMTFYERLHNTFVGLFTLFTGYFYYLPKVQETADTYFNYTGWEERPKIGELLSTTSLTLVNSHYSVGYPYPMAPHVVEVGGVHIQPRKQLPKDLQLFMDEATDGVIYFSLGSNLNVSNIATGDIFTAFQGAFSKLKQKVLWKWEKDEFPNKPPNVRSSKWFPQQDILAHENCKLFITHGGLLSLSEATYFGVPMVGIPFFGDQGRNVRQITNAGTGVKLELDEITEEAVTKAINEILSNPSYRERARERSELFRDRPMGPLESAAYWVEWVVRHRGAPQLRPASADMPWYQLHLIDVWAALLGAFVLALALIYSILRSLARLLCGRKAQKSRIEKKSKKKTN